MFLDMKMKSDSDLEDSHVKDLVKSLETNAALEIVETHAKYINLRDLSKKQFLALCGDVQKS